MIYIVPKGTYANLAEAQADLAGTDIHYQLATPQLINLTEEGLTDGTLMSFENGTCYLDSDTFHSPHVTLDVPTNIGAQISANTQGIQLHSNQINAKADKVQGERITPTLLNSWVASTGGIDYFIDDFNNVHIEGNISGGIVTSGTLIFTLPVGYRPNKTIPILAIRADDGTYAVIYVAVDGGVRIYGNQSTGVFRLSGLFRAEA